MGAGPPLSDISDNKVDNPAQRRPIRHRLEGPHGPTYPLSEAGNTSQGGLGAAVPPCVSVPYVQYTVYTHPGRHIGRYTGRHTTYKRVVGRHREALGNLFRCPGGMGGSREPLCRCLRGMGGSREPLNGSWEAWEALGSLLTVVYPAWYTGRHIQGIPSMVHREAYREACWVLNTHREACWVLKTPKGRTAAAARPSRARTIPVSLLASSSASRLYSRFTVGQ